MKRRSLNIPTVRCIVEVSDRNENSRGPASLSRARRRPGISNWIGAANSAVPHVGARYRSLALRAVLDGTSQLLRRIQKVSIHQVIETLFFVAQLHGIVRSGTFAFPLELCVVY